MRKHFFLPAAIVAFALAGCAPAQVEYNSNSGTNSSLSTAATVGLGQLTSAELNAPAGNNEDWYAFSIAENGFIVLEFSADSPSNLIFNVALTDSFSRPLDSLTTNANNNVYVFDKREIEPGDYFISVITNMDQPYGDASDDGKTGVSNYAFNVKFELPPPPEPVVEATPEPEVKQSKTQCVPADKCKSGQNCCKPKTPKPAPVAEEKVVSGNIVSITPQGSKVIIKISGIGTKTGVRKGATGKLKGSSLEAHIYSCAENACQATVDASTDEVNRYKTVDVTVK